MRSKTFDVLLVFTLLVGVAQMGLACDLVPVASATEAVIDVIAPETGGEDLPGVAAVVAVPAPLGGLLAVAETAAGVSADGGAGLPSPQDLTGELATPFGMALIGWVLAYFLLEACKAIIPAFDSATPNLKRVLAVSFGAIGGLLLCLTHASPLPWWSGLIYGALGAGGVAATRGLALLKRYGPSDVSPKGFSRIGFLGMVGILALGVILLGCARLTDQVKADNVASTSLWNQYVQADAALTLPQRHDRAQLATQQIYIGTSGWASKAYVDVAQTITCQLDRYVEHDGALGADVRAGLHDKTQGIRVALKLPAACPVPGVTP